MPGIQRYTVTNVMLVLPGLHLPNGHRLGLQSCTSIPPPALTMLAW